MMIKSMTAQPCFLIHLFHKHPKIYFCLFSAVLYHIMILWNMLSTCSDNDTGNIQTSRHFARPYYFAVFSFPTMLNIKTSQKLFTLLSYHIPEDKSTIFTIQQHPCRLMVAFHGFSAYSIVPYSSSASPVNPRSAIFLLRFRCIS